MNIYVIGCGGIGGYLCQMLPMSIVSVSLDAIAKHIHEIIKPNDIVLTIGAGTITKLSDLL